MKRKEFTIGFSFAILLIFLVLPVVSAQTTLYPNETLENEVIWGRNDSFYDPGTYEVALEAGHWTIVVQPLFDLEVNVSVATDSGMTDVIAVSGTGRGNYPEADFTLDSADTVYIIIHENSVYGDSQGLYNIGVYDDAHLATLTTNTITFPTTYFTGTNPFQPFEFLNTIFFVLGIVVLVILIIGIVACIRMRSTAAAIEQQVIRAPQTAIPQKYHDRTEVDEGLRMVRIPVECPKCKAPLSQETIDWVGPLEAKCQYCGSTVRATFEKV